VLVAALAERIGMNLSYRHLLLVGAVGLAGCQLFGGTGGNGGAAYPATPPGSASTTAPSAAAVATTAPTILKVPADAQELSSGDYPPPGFTVPNQPGTIEVVDLDGDPTVAVASTSVTGTEANKTMSISDVPNMALSLNKNHKYKIVFVPQKSGTSAP
jgi:hypothetical protein